MLPLRSTCIVFLSFLLVTAQASPTEIEEFEIAVASGVRGTLTTAPGQPAEAVVLLLFPLCMLLLLLLCVLPSVSLFCGGVLPFRVPTPVHQ